MTEPTLVPAYHRHPGVEPEMWNEWQAWQGVVTELTKCSAAIDINEEPRLNGALVFWGECMGMLRAAQTEEIRAEAMHAAEVKLLASRK